MAYGAVLGQTPSVPEIVDVVETGNMNGVTNNAVAEAIAAIPEGVRMQIVSYVGTGTYGASHPCSITADFPIKFALMIGYSQYQSNIMLTPGTMIATFSGTPGFYINNDYSRSYGKTSVDKKTITWYSGTDATQLNESNKTYQVLCVG